MNSDRGRFWLRGAIGRLIGKEATAYLLHLRPLEWPVMTAHLLLGTFLAKGWPPPKSTFTAWLVFVVLLNGGTLALNSAFDQDEGDIGYLRQPPKPPKYLAHFGFLLLASSLLWSSYFLRTKPGGKYFFEIVMTCVLMSVLYSVPPIRLKARAGWDLLINCLGFGFFTPMAGWCATGRGLEPVLVDFCIGFFFLFAALYPLTQIYQIEEDMRRGDQTLVIRMGVGRSLNYALGATVVAHLWFLQAILKHHRQLVNAGFVDSAQGISQVLQLPQGGPPAAFIGISLLAWLGVLLPWRLGWKTWTPAQAEAGMYRGLLAWGITDVSLLILLWPK